MSVVKRFTGLMILVNFFWLHPVLAFINYFKTGHTPLFWDDYLMMGFGLLKNG